MKKFTLIMSLIYFLLVGYTYPDNTPYVIVSCRLGNNYTIHFAENQLEYLYVSDTSIISSYSSTLYGYGYGDQRISFPTYNNPTYSTGYNTVDLRITEVKENHLYDKTENKIKRNYNAITIGLLGGIIIICFFRKSQ